MTDKSIGLETLILELRSGAETDAESARRVALACADFAEQPVAFSDETPSTKIEKALLPL
jgi:hypothetical protein